MHKLTATAIMAICVTLTGCTIYGELTPIGDDKTTFAGRENGTPYVYSKLSNGVVVATPSLITSGERFRIYVQTANSSDSQFSFSTDNITAYATEHGVANDVHVYSREELIEEEKRRQMWNAIAIALSGAAQSMNAANAGYSHSYGTYSNSYNGNIYTPNNWGTFNGTTTGTYSGTTYNPYISQMAQAQARAETSRQMDALMAAGAANIKELGSNILSYNEVPPGSVCGGQVEVDGVEVTDEVEKFCVLVTTGGEQHQMLFNITKIGS